MPWFMWFIVLALVFYTWAVLGSQHEDELCPFFVWLFVAGFVCDLIGTSPMIAKAHCLSLHVTLGCAALIIMGLHASWAWLSLRRPTLSLWFHRWSPSAYTLWLFTLITGGVLHWMGR